ncbi:hypothetical protein CASFOL_011745 [Castilleja foliolosa]|uniref:Uncharacterized protein n=1 Tax=Castilleja foliolosa TaxID=1961234 RepID=A0ABD3DEH7_9LAMI
MGQIYLASILAFWSVMLVTAEDAYKYYDWTVTYKQAFPLGIPQQVIHINGSFPGPTIDCVTNDNIIVNIVNQLDVPFLLTWNGIKQRKNSWQDGVLGTNCPILPGKNFTYKFQTKDQIGSFTYFPSTAMQRAVGGFGAFNVLARSVISVPYEKPAGDYSLLIGDWQKDNHKILQQKLDLGQTLPDPVAILINGAQQGLNFSGEQGKTYMFRISNIGLAIHINFRIQSHKLKLVEVEGCNVNQTTYESLDVFVGQTVTVLVTLDQPPSAYYIVASSTFAKTYLNTTAVLKYTTANVSKPAGLVPIGPDSNLDWSMNQSMSIRWGLKVNAARPNPQDSYHYSKIKINRTITLENSARVVTGKQRYAVNNISYVIPETPLKLADFFQIPNVFQLNFPQNASLTGPNYGFYTYVLGVSLHEFVEIVFQNNEEMLQTWHLDGYDFWVMGMGKGQWTNDSRYSNSHTGTDGYNLRDAYTRHTLQVFPKSWAAIYVSLDNVGMWNLRSAMWPRQYLGHQLYIRVNNSVQSSTIEYTIPHNTILCGKAENETIPTS